MMPVGAVAAVRRRDGLRERRAVFHHAHRQQRGAHHGLLAEGQAALDGGADVLHVHSQPERLVRGA